MIVFLICVIFLHRIDVRILLLSQLIHFDLTKRRKYNRIIEKGTKSSCIRGDQTIRKDDFMPTTNISQIISDVIGSVRFFRKEQRRFFAEYSIALFLPAHKNTSRLARFCSSSQSSISRLLSSQSLSTRDLSYARVDYISRFLHENSLEFKYIILDETVMKRR